MYQLLHNLSATALLRQQFPVFSASFLIAEFFYKFHSFVLECAAFLVTWYVFDAVLQWALPKNQR